MNYQSYQATYRTCLEAVAPAENARMKETIGRQYVAPPEKRIGALVEFLTGEWRSAREVSAELQVSPQTASNWISHAKREGLIESTERKGELGHMSAVHRAKETT